MKITCLILTKNNEKTLPQTLAALKDLPVIVGDLGSNDGTEAACKEIEFVRLTAKNFAAGRNELSNMVGDGLVFHIEPWEILTKPLKDLSKNKYKISILQDSIITKEVRIWPAQETVLFENPLYPKVTAKGLEQDIILYSKGPNISLQQGLEILNQWQEDKPKLPDVTYYRACLYLSNRRYDDFILEAKRYLLLEKKNMPSLMTRYYLSLIFLHVKNNPRDAIKNLLYCISHRPELSELWSALGDCFYKMNSYKKAKAFYENALALGGHRKNNDWPLEIDKCLEYPEKMILSCDEMTNNAVFLKYNI
jgi:tetratricopeptide (TPR) repeat protein